MLRLEACQRPLATRHGFAALLAGPGGRPLSCPATLRPGSSSSRRRRLSGVAGQGASGSLRDSRKAQPRGSAAPKPPASSLRASWGAGGVQLPPRTGEAGDREPCSALAGVPGALASAHVRTASAGSLQRSAASAGPGLELTVWLGGDRDGGTQLLPPGATMAASLATHLARPSACSPLTSSSSRKSCFGLRASRYSLSSTAESAVEHSIASTSPRPDLGLMGSRGLPGAIRRSPVGGVSQGARGGVGVAVLNGDAPGESTGDN
mmetsp:Transcript_8511/g.26467  ORF Transcript_8511/g.26467 Transcript_8511/m.26467 type:complete len:264 (-) Transcript_8511:1561-2352(-)